MKNMINKQKRNTSKLLLLPPKRACAAAINRRVLSRKVFWKWAAPRSTHNALCFIYIHETKKQKTVKRQWLQQHWSTSKAGTQATLHSGAYLSGQRAENHIKKAIKRTPNKSVFERIFRIEYFRSLLPLRQQQQ